MTSRVGISRALTYEHAVRISSVEFYSCCEMELAFNLTQNRSI